MGPLTLTLWYTLDTLVLDGTIRDESMPINYLLRLVVMYCLTGGGHNFM